MIHNDGLINFLTSHISVHSTFNNGGRDLVLVFFFVQKPSRITMNYAIFSDRSFNPLDDEIMPSLMGRGSTSMFRPPLYSGLYSLLFFLVG